MWKFLILYRGLMDDLVLGAYADREEAEAEAKKLCRYYARWETSERTQRRRLAAGKSPYKPHHALVLKALAVYSLDVGTYCNISILALGDKGEPEALWVYE